MTGFDPLIESGLAVQRNGATSLHEVYAGKPEASNAKRAHDNASLVGESDETFSTRWH